MKISEYFTREKLESLGIYRFGFNSIRVGWDEVHYIRDMDVEDFKILEDDFIKHGIRGIGPTKAEILIWLRDYLNGKVDGKYEKVKLEPENEEIIRLNEIIERKNDKIREIRAKKAIIEDENKQLRAEIKELKKKENVYLKIKEYFLKEEFLKD